VANEAATHVTTSGANLQEPSGFLSGGGNLGALTRVHDWAHTPLGAVDTWPQSLRTAVSIMLNSKHPMFIAWGPELTFLYNDGYQPILGAKHPAALGNRFEEIWAEIWEDILPFIERAMTGDATWSDDLELHMERRGYLEETYFTFSYSAIRDETGGVGGMFCACTETTGKVLSERRLRCLRDLAAAAAEARAIEQAETACFETLGAYSVDVPYALLYRFDEHGGARRVASINIEADAPAAPMTIGSTERVWELQRVLRGETVTIDDLAALFGTVPRSHWGDDVRQACVFPIFDPREGEIAAPSEALVLGVSPRRSLDEPYRSFLSLVANYVGMAMANARGEAFKRALAKSEAEFRTLADNIHHFAWMTDASGWIYWYNKRWFDFTGTTLEQMQGWGWRKVHHPDHVDRVVEKIAHCFETGEPWEDTFPLRGKDGAYRWFLSRAVPIRDDRGHVVRWLGTNTDITERLDAEEHRNMLIDELNHRVKNTLVTVQSIAAQALRGAAAEPAIRDAIESRLVALSRSHDLLTRENWGSASLNDVVLEALAPFRTDRSGNGYNRRRRFTIRGPEVRLRPKAALALGMAFHELLTNAVKYGALSNESGTIRILWKNDGGSLRLRWAEQGGPCVEPPARRGFGSRLIERSLGRELGGSVTLRYEPAGVVCEIEMPTGAGAAQ
jgi:PAS domain S-box-containing protein